MSDNQHIAAKLFPAVELRYSERDAVGRERRAWIAGATWGYERQPSPQIVGMIAIEANRRFPDPPRPPVTDSEGVSWRLNAGGIEYRYPTGEPSWFSLPSSLKDDSIQSPRLTLERLDLLQHMRSEAE